MKTLAAILLILLLGSMTSVQAKLHNGPEITSFAIQPGDPDQLVATLYALSHFFFPLFLDAARAAGS